MSPIFVHATYLRQPTEILSSSGSRALVQAYKGSPAQKQLSVDKSPSGENRALNALFVVNLGRNPSKGLSFCQTVGEKSPLRSLTSGQNVKSPDYIKHWLARGSVMFSQEFLNCVITYATNDTRVIPMQEIVTVGIQKRTTLNVLLSSLPAAKKVANRKIANIHGWA
jgi:hypothetical protein